MNNSEGYARTIEEIFKPLSDKHGEEIQLILENDPKMKSQIEKEVNRILEMRRIENDSSNIWHWMFMWR